MPKTQRWLLSSICYSLVEFGLLNIMFKFGSLWCFTFLSTCLNECLSVNPGCSCRSPRKVPAAAHQPPADAGRMAAICRALQPGSHVLSEPGKVGPLPHLQSGEYFLNHDPPCDVFSRKNMNIHLCQGGFVTVDICVALSKIPYEWMLMTFLGSVDNGPMKSWLHFGDV